jgi:hypothetical protein
MYVVAVRYDLLAVDLARLINNNLFELLLLLLLSIIIIIIITILHKVKNFNFAAPARNKIASLQEKRG